MTDQRAASGRTRAPCRRDFYDDDHLPYGSASRAFLESIGSLLQ